MCTERTIDRWASRCRCGPLGGRADEAVRSVEAVETPGPLAGVRVVEVGGIGPGPFAGMVLADLGAQVTRVDRPGGPELAALHRVLLRGRRSVVCDLKQEQGREVVRRLAARSDVLLEGFRPGVMERLGLGPDELLRRHPALVYGRMTGWGQDGPLAQRAGHDITYLALSGALEPIAGGDLAPVPPHNMLGDFGGGGMLLAVGVLSALLHARATGAGQVVDAAIVDGAGLMTSMLHGMRAAGVWPGPRGENLFDGGAPFYRVYPTADGRWLAVGAIEPQFYAQLLDGLGLADELAGVPQHDRSRWPRLRERFAQRIAERTRAQWEEVFDGTDACVAPVLDPDEAAVHPHAAARGSFLARPGLTEPTPAPRFSRTPPADPTPAPEPGADTAEVLAELGLDPGDTG